MADNVEAIHTWFSLTYSNYLVLPRSVLQSMPDDWQKSFVENLEKLEEYFDYLEFPVYYVQAYKREPEFITPYIDCPECDGTGEINKGYCPECGGEEEIEDPEGSRYEKPDEVGFRDDPIPHYNRGRTKLDQKVVK